MKLSELLTVRVIILIAALIIALISINPSLSDVNGVAIKAVVDNSSAKDIGILQPRDNLPPRNREIILSINGNDINNLNDYVSIIDSIDVGNSVRITTNVREYDPFLKNSRDIGIVVDKAAKTNIRKGLDLEGGTRVLLTAVGEVSEQDIVNARDTIANRLNVFGLSDINVRIARDLTGERYIVAEVAGASKEDVRELVGKQGKFEAKIGNETVFIGGERDVVFVCRNNAQCSGVLQCNEALGGEQCRFEFQITLSDSAAQRQADATEKLEVNLTNGEYLTKPLDLYLDDKLVDSLLISSSLKGSKSTQITISGPGSGLTREEALKDALDQMNKLQTVLITGSLPFKLEIVKLDSISPKLGNEFIRNAIITGLIAILAVGTLVYIRYRRLAIAIPMLATMGSEIILLLGFAALVKYNLDIAAIAGIILSVGTGIDHQIVIADEVIKDKEVTSNWKERIKRAFFIIFSAYAATFVAMLPLLWAGAGLLTGFAVATLTGMTIGVFVTRPAFASVIEKLLKE